MIYTLTLNPSLDYHICVDDFHMGKTNRSSKERMILGGKGLNVSMMLNNLGVENIALGIACGFVGEEIIRQINQNGIKHQFITQQSSNSRINIKFDGNESTEINGNGPDINESFSQLLTQLEKLKDDDVLVISGSAPKSIGTNWPLDVMHVLRGKNVSLIVDCPKSVTEMLLPYHPLLIKPNKDELELLAGQALLYRKNIIEAAKTLNGKGAQNVLVSLGGKGALLLDANNEIHQCDAPEGQVVSTVGCGDCMIAGYLYGLREGYNCEELLRFAIACGSGSAFGEGFADQDTVMKLLSQITINKIYK